MRQRSRFLTLTAALFAAFFLASTASAQIGGNTRGGGGGGGGGGTPSGSTNDIQTNAGGGNFGHITPGAGVATFLATPSSANLLSALTTSTGTGLAVFGTSPTLTTPVLGVATGTSLALGGATLGGNALAVTGHLLFEGVTSTGATGTGNLVYATSPTFTTPTLGVASGTSFNKWVFTAPATATTMVSGADNLTYTMPATTSTIMAANFSNAAITQNSPADGGSHSYTLLSSDLTKQVILASTFTSAAIPQATGSFAAPADFTLCTLSRVTVTSTTSTVGGFAGATGITMGANQCLEFTASGGNWGVSLAFGTVLGSERDVSGTTDTLLPSDCGQTVAYSNAGAVTVTIPAAIVPVAGVTCQIAIRQDGAGQVAVNGSAVSAATLVSAHSYTKTFGAHAVIGLELTTISATATAVLTGDGA